MTNLGKSKIRYGSYIQSPEDSKIPRIEGYADQLSVIPGQAITFHISTTLKKYSVVIARIGVKREPVWAKEDIAGVEHSVPEDASSHGCRWPPAFSLTVPGMWRSGYYCAQLSGCGVDGGTVQGKVSFVVRSASPGCDTSILLQRTTNTDNAYNSWGGTTLYNGPNGPGTRVSFDRPFAGFPGCERYLGSISADSVNDLDRCCTSDELTAALVEIDIYLSEFCNMQVASLGNRWHILDAGNTFTCERKKEAIHVYDGFTTWQSNWHHWESHFVNWAEGEGYEIDYAVNSDLEFHPNILNHYRLVLSVGHDEYWSSPMRDNLENFIGNGGNVVFFSGNTAWWQVRSEDSGRALTCWKDEYESDPIYRSGDRKLLSIMWCHPLVNRPENYLTGVSFAYGGYSNFFDQNLEGPWGYTVHNPEHWIFQGTGLQRGDIFGDKDMVVNYECDGCDFHIRNGIPVPTYRDGTPETFQILGTAPASLSSADQSLEMVSKALYGPHSTQQISQPGAAVLGTYERGGTVVTTGCTDWVSGLRGGDSHVVRITRNILDRLSN